MQKQYAFVHRNTLIYAPNTVIDYLHYLGISYFQIKYLKKVVHHFIRFLIIYLIIFTK